MVLINDDMTILDIPFIPHDYKHNRMYNIIIKL